MNQVREFLDQARDVIDGEVDCNTPEYRALDLLHRAIDEIDTRLTRAEQASRSGKHVARN